MADDNEKTIRLNENQDQGDDNEKTIRIENDGSKEDVDPDKTIRTDAPDNILRADQPEADEEKTIRADAAPISADAGAPIKAGVEPEEDPEKTVRAGSDVIESKKKTAPAEKTIGSKVGDIGKKTSEYILNDKKYKEIKTLSQSTGEAEIYLLEKDGEQSVLKLYYPFFKPKEKLVEQLRNIKHEDIISVLDYGWYEEKRFFELLEYCAGGTVEDHMPIKDTAQIKQIIKETINALEFCHQHKIVHRDIKPGNLFFKNADGTDILLGDFGISSLIEDSETMQRTTMFRTATYAAPEVEHGTGGESIITKAVDYYAFGISILHMFTGVPPSKGFDELTYRTLKFKAKLPIPEDMPEEIETLVKGLITVDDEKRWGFEEVQKWLKGEQVSVYEMPLREGYKPFNFTRDRNGLDLVATTPEEMAALMQDYPELGRKYLYRGAVEKWLEEAGDNELMIEIKDIIEAQFKKDEVTGTQVAIYTLDSTRPYLAHDGSKCETKTEIAKALFNSFDHYKNALQDKNDLLYLYLNSRGGRKEVKVFRKYFKDNDPQTALYWIIYSLLYADNQETPLILFGSRDEKDPKSVVINSIEELADKLESDPKKYSPYLYSGEISIWLDFRDPGIREKVDEQITNFKDVDKEAGLLAVVYTLAQDKPYVCPFTGKTSSEADPQFGTLLSGSAIEYKSHLKNPNTSLHIWLLTHGYNGEVNFFRKCYDPSYHEGKIAPYNDDIAFMKILKAIYQDDNVPYIADDGSEYYNPEELLNAPSHVKKEVIDRTMDPNSPVSALLSIHFHEYPFDEEGEYFVAFQEDYEERLIAYLDFLEKLNPKTEPVKRYVKAKKEIVRLKRKEKAKDNRFLIQRILTFAFPTLSTILATFYALTFDENPLPGNVLSLDFNYYLIMILPVTIWAIWEGFKGDGDLTVSQGCIGGPIIGAILFVAVYYLFYFILGNPILLGILLLLVLGTMIGWMLKVGYTDKNLRKQLYGDNEQMAGLVNCAAYAYSDEKEFANPLEELFKNYRRNRRSTKLSMWRTSFIGVVIPVALYALLYSVDPRVTDLITTLKLVGEKFIEVYYISMNFFVELYKTITVAIFG
ncbi:MAG: protein kinase [Melioribacteraceae bacterium]|nr:protein kinase [Melioribacteraceae bacterium]MCF8355932.1 protein kinase [Melioribacteraceae bacterium]MCF8395472.1 protein kinase [Melioribacteraceae bacterium]MCF8420774.1 protein kinase [Melioribacteraceae bacterium]